MKAAFITETGSPDVIQVGTLDDPVPGPCDVVVRVGAVAVNPIDTYVRGGAVPMPREFPYVIGCDLAGHVEATGPEVTRFQVGDRVWGSNQGLAGRQGTFSELAAVDEQWLYATPDHLSDAEAAAGALVGITAHLGLFLHADLQAGQRVFVNGGSGGVGAAVVQLAVAAGADVVTTAGSPDKADYCKTIGASAVLDYRHPEFRDTLRALVEKDGGFDVWYETLREQSLDETIGLMVKRGRIVVMAGRNARPELPVGPLYVNDLRLVGFAMFNATADEQRVCAETINRLAEEGQWRANIGARLPLADATEAHRLQEEKTLHNRGDLRGKIVLEL